MRIETQIQIQKANLMSKINKTQTYTRHIDNSLDCSNRNGIGYTRNREGGEKKNKCGVE